MSDAPPRWLSLLVDKRIGLARPFPWGSRIGLYCDSAKLRLRDAALLELKDSDDDELSQQFDAAAGGWGTQPAF